MKNMKLVHGLLLVIAGATFGCHNQKDEVAQRRSDAIAPEGRLTDLVNPLMGTDSEFKLSNGNTYPAIALPWGMNFWTPQTAKMGDGWAYKYDDYTIRGIKQTHQPSPWINDYAAFSLMPVTGRLKYQEDERQSWFSHRTEIVKPHYYKVYLADYHVEVEVTPTERAAQFRFTFPESDSAYILLDAFFKGSSVQIIPEERKIIGYCRNNSGGVPDNFHNYFVAEFDKPFTMQHTWGDDWKLFKNTTESAGDHVGAIVGFKTNAGEKIHVKVASSFISHEQAALNLQNEIGEDTFDETKAKGLQAWENELNRIKVEAADIDHIKTFYSCLYRLLLFPRKFYEIDKAGQIMHYSPYNGEVLPGYMFTDNGFWDTFRAVFPFFTLMYPELNGQIMQGLVNTYKESGWLPEWASPGHRNSMIGSNSASLIADAYLKGIKDFDVETLFEAMIKNASVSEGRPTNSVGRAGIDYYNSLGYVPYDVGINENAARTLEYAYADFTVSQLARALGKEEEEQLFLKKSKNYQHLFDPSTKLMRGKMKNGEFQSPFNPFKWGDAFTEGNSWHYSWSVFHDIQGLMNLMGGKKEFNAMLDSVFNLPPIFDESYYGIVIHEIREMQIVNMGQYAHGNQPIQHMIYLYNYGNQPWKSQQRAREVMQKLYSPAPDGYCGDEDNGQTSAWYVFSALGFYPVCPGTDQYVFGSPLFNKATLTLESGKEFVIEAQGNGVENYYIQSAELNGESYNYTWIDHETIQNGGSLKFTMGGSPNKDWATSPDAVPYSLTEVE
ncbi:GH92 family glycosyl hydrolase [Fulvivirgaceae bacterium BMA12]|uniref:GH92 family glycosyl hydrolase n=1 Tax=Agaribacillus aureus TaxID=3051825 RepID=A0ABT8L9Q8_9BACT|nr:GH92 family glycosyl hydrolase [Fulvivirgaceae bacterium BMA12]